MIIGYNVLEAFWELGERHGNKGDPHAVHSLLGWTLIFPMERMECKKSHYCVNFTKIVYVLMQQLERFWKTENAGGNGMGQCPASDCPDLAVLPLLLKSDDIC